ncbi:MAG: hypothetical protein C0399_03315 [Syntrophus sp. (in: bacteria)]|nr:hypothetical protein [Syntrophus sp. (in: bacteria)]
MSPFNRSHRRSRWGGDWLTPVAIGGNLEYKLCTYSSSIWNIVIHLDFVKTGFQTYNGMTINAIFSTFYEDTKVYMEMFRGKPEFQRSNELPRNLLRGSSLLL